jgi:hypothetical protein
VDSLRREDVTWSDDFDPAQVVGDVRDKLDAIKFKIDDWLGKAEMLKTQWLEPIMKERNALIKRAERLEDYVRFEMEQNQFEKIPGNLWSARFRLNPPSVNITMPATADLFWDFPNYVKETVSYSFDREAIKADIKAGKEVPFASIKQTKRLEFVARKEGKE